MPDPAQTPSRPDRKAFKRINVSRAERITSLAIVALLAALGIAVWVQGRNFDPGLYSLRPEALKSTGLAVEGKSVNQGERASRPISGMGILPMREVPNTGRMPVPQIPAEETESGGTPMPPDQAAASESPEGYAETSASPPLAAGSPSSKAKPIELPGAQPMGETEVYSPETLYEKINGRAPAYLDFRFQELRTRSFSELAGTGSYVDVYEYRMDSPVNAFGIFAIERDPDGKPLDFAPDGYSGEMGFFFRQGNCYVQVIASDQKPGTLKLARSAAEHLAKSIPADDTGLNARRRLPAQGIAPDSIAFTQDNAQGQSFLKDVFQANYTFDGKKYTFFLMVTTPEAAAKAWADYLAFSSRYGGTAEALPEIAGATVFQAQNFGKWKVVYQRGEELGGVIDAQDPVAARAFLEAILQGKLR